MTAVLRLLPLIAERPRLFLETLLWNLVVQLGVLSLACGLAWVVGRVAADRSLDLLGSGVILSVIGLATALATWREAWTSHALAYRLIGVLRARLFRALSRGLPERRRPRHSGDLSGTALSDVDTLEWLYAHTAAQAISAIAMLAVSAAVSLMISPWLLVVWAPLLVASVLIPRVTAGIAAVQAQTLARQEAALRSELIDTIRGLRELRGAGALEERRVELAARTREMSTTQSFVASRAGIERAAIDLLLSVAAIGSITIAAAGVAQFEAELIPLAFTISTAALVPAAQIADLFRNAGSLRESARRIVEVLDLPPATTAPQIRPDEPIGVEEGLEFQHVVFRYDGEHRPGLDDVSFHIRPGETVALAGPSGAGKTTCARLALRLWDPDGGVVRIGGIDATRIPDDDFRTLVSGVPQGAPLLRGTIESNLRLGAPEASDAQLMAAAEQAGILAPTAGLPEGLATPVGERGEGLSGGQRARVAIARALVVQPKVLILDEATAALDADADAAIAEFLRRPSRRATLVIAHRTSTLSAADRVLTIRNGKLTDPLVHQRGSQALHA